MTKPLIIYARRNIHDLRECILENFGSIKYELPFIGALCVDAPEETVEQIKNNRRVALVAEDAAVQKLPIHPVPFAKTFEPEEISSFPTRAPSPFAGSGVSIAVIDTGVSPHYDLVKPQNRLVAFKDFINGKKMPYDDDGHGTHVAGIAAGNGYACGRQYTGTAPDAEIVALKALDENGNGQTSDILAAMQWILLHASRYNVRVINLSLGLLAEEDNPADPLLLGANALVRHGLSVVTAAGNSGPGKCTITSPGTSPLVITVGSANKNLDGIPSFSSRGPTLTGLRKPDVVAPGVDIVSLDAKTCKKYISQSGTSMSAPMVSGVAACLRAAFPRFSPLQVKKIILSSASPFKKEDRDASGHGLVNLSFLE